MNTLQERHLELAKQGRVDLRDVAHLADRRSTVKPAQQVATPDGRLLSIE